MKNVLIALLCILIAVSFCACNSNEDETITSPVSFYYCLSEIDYERDNGVIAPETRDASLYEDDFAQIMNIYLKGPIGEGFYSPFPDNGNVVNLFVGDANAHIVLDSSFTSLTGIDLTLARICIAKTLIGLTQAQTVQISVENAVTGSRQTVTVRPENFLFGNSDIVISESED